MTFNPQGFGQQAGGSLQDIFGGGGGGGGGGGDPQQDAFMQMLSQFIKEGRLGQFNQDEFLNGEEDELFQQQNQQQGGLGDLLGQGASGILPGGLFNNISMLQSLFGQGGGQ